MAPRLDRISTTKQAGLAEKHFTINGKQDIIIDKQQQAAISIIDRFLTTPKLSDALKATVSIHMAYLSTPKRFEKVDVSPILQHIKQNDIILRIWLDSYIHKLPYSKVYHPKSNKALAFSWRIDSLHVVALATSKHGLLMPTELADLVVDEIMLRRLDSALFQALQAPPRYRAKKRNDTFGPKHKSTSIPKKALKDSMRLASSASIRQKKPRINVNLPRHLAPNDSHQHYIDILESILGYFPLGKRSNTSTATNYMQSLLDCKHLNRKTVGRLGSHHRGGEWHVHSIHLAEKLWCPECALHKGCGDFLNSITNKPAAVKRQLKERVMLGAGSETGEL